jgi:putative pyrroloquinoline-quinone-binding quinoprotein
VGRHSLDGKPWWEGRFRIGVAVVVVLIVVAALAPFGDDGGAPTEGRRSAGGMSQRRPTPSPTPSAEPQPINTEFEGLTTFRGNATRTYYGEGPVPSQPEIVWEYPAEGGMCSTSTDEHGTRLWCGTGWTGQPNVVEGPDEKIEVRFGAYDGGVHTLNGKNGKEVLDTFVTGDLIKGTVTSDPDGYPLLYTGSRDNYLRVLALDQGRTPVELWALDAESAPNPVWNNDWDGSPLVIDDHLIEGGENSWFYVVKLNRGYDDRGNVTVAPKIKAMVPGFDEKLLSDLGDDNVSIENSVAFDDGIAYFANSGGLVQGWDISRVLDGGGNIKRVFRFWTGDDTDASVVIDDEGYLYVASELERLNARAVELGQLMKLDPRRNKNPLVWSIPVPGTGGSGGMWATPALHGKALFAPTNSGRLLAVNRERGRIAWEVQLPGPLWSSPVVVDDTLIVGDCEGVLHAYDVSRPLNGRPTELWTVSLPGCIESTPAVWKGMIYVGTRSGKMYGIGDRH